MTRRYYRSGESDYFINKTACRLKDITELFLGTGVGAKAYAIIEQGRVRGPADVEESSTVAVDQASAAGEAADGDVLPAGAAGRDGMVVGRIGEDLPPMLHSENIKQTKQQNNCSKLIISIF